MILYKFQSCSISLKYIIETLIGIALNLFVALGKMVILTMLIFLVHEQGILFNLFITSSVYFNILIVL